MERSCAFSQAALWPRPSRVGFEEGLRGPRTSLCHVTPHRHYSSRHAQRSRQDRSLPPCFRVVTRNLKVSPMVPRERPLIGRAAAARGSKVVVAAARARGRWVGSESQLQPEPRPGSAAGASPVVLGPLASRCTMASLSLQSGGASKKEEKGKNIQVVVRCR